MALILNIKDKHIGLYCIYNIDASYNTLVM